jgi:hypothetical protein
MYIVLCEYLAREGAIASIVFPLHAFHKLRLVVRILGHWERLYEQYLSSRISPRLGNYKHPFLHKSPLRTPCSSFPRALTVHAHTLTYKGSVAPLLKAIRTILINPRTLPVA